MSAKDKPFLRHVKSVHDFITTPRNAKAMSIAIANERNRRAGYYLDEARDLKFKAKLVQNPRLLRHVHQIDAAIMAAAGVSKQDPCYSLLDKELVLNRLVAAHLEPAGDAFVEELVFRFLLTRGDSLGGSMRNVGGVLAQRKLARALMAALTNAGTAFRWLHGPTEAWADVPPSGTAGLEVDLRGLSWKKGKAARTLIFNLRVPTVRNSVDLCLMNCAVDEDFDSAVGNPARYLTLGELKGGIDPNGADEHWKTAGTALGRIREALRKQNLNPPIFYVGAAIAERMASEIWEQLQDGRLINAANLTRDDQVASLCGWLCEL